MTDCPLNGMPVPGRDDLTCPVPRSVISAMVSHARAHPWPGNRPLTCPRHVLDTTAITEPGRPTRLLLSLDVGYHNSGWFANSDVNSPSCTRVFTMHKELAGTRALFVYVIGESEDGPLKLGIGASAAKRLGELQIGNPRKLHLYHAVSHPDAADIECALQRRLHEHHLRGEWFNMGVPQALSALATVVAMADEGRLPHYVRSPTLREIDGVIERCCCTCKEWLPLAAFHISRNRPIGRQGRCKQCGLTVNRERMATDATTRLRRNEKARVAQNRRRAAARGGREARSFRFTPGGPNPRAKLSADERAALRCRRSNGESASDLAAEFGVSASYVRMLGNSVKVTTQDQGGDVDLG